MRPIWKWVLLSLAAWAASDPACGAEPGTSLRVMSFNIRFGTAADGPNHWDVRKQFLLETIKDFNPDLLGTQETLGFQRDFLAEELSGYEVFGAGRNDGKEDGEMMALYYRKDRFEKIDAGHFWLSDTPNRPGSRSWDSALPRMVTWVELRDRRSADGRPIAFFNTHFDHRGVMARRQSAALLRQRLLERCQDCSLIVTGDFNAGEGSPPYQALFQSIDGHDSPVIDTFRAARPERQSDEGTFSGFMLMVRGGPRIDWIAASRDWIVRDADIVHVGRDGRTPSDHFPVTAVLSRASEKKE